MLPPGGGSGPIPYQAGLFWSHLWRVDELYGRAVQRGTADPVVVVGDPNDRLTGPFVREILAAADSGSPGTTGAGADDGIAVVPAERDRVLAALRGRSEKAEDVLAERLPDTYLVVVAAAGGFTFIHASVSGSAHGSQEP